jgi:hypothetical protein
MCRFLISAALSIVMFAACIYLATLTTQPGSATSPDTVDPNAAQLRPDGIARLRQQMELRIAPFQPVAAKFVTDRVAKVYFAIFCLVNFENQDFFKFILWL